jgi:hypothetical protein
MRKKTLNKFTAGESGQALIIVVLLMLVSAIVIAPMLAHVRTGLKTGKEIFEEKMLGQYAADSGVEDALFKIQTDDPLFPDEWDGPWTTQNAYDTEYTYTISSPVNGNNVDVTIQPDWVLTDLETPPSGMTPHADMVVVGDTVGVEDGNGLYQIAINVTEDDKTLHVERIGAWLPSSYSYVPGSSNLEAASGKAHCVPVTVPHRGGNAIIWNFSEPRPKFEELPGTGLKRIVTFQFTPNGRPSSAFSWVKIQSEDVDLSWDIDVKYYQITSEATGIGSGKTLTVEAHVAENEMRQMGTAVSGDYFAAGNSLIGGSGHPPDNYHYQLYKSTQSSISTNSDPTVGIPADATMQAAYLYWTGWIDWHNYEPEEIFFDDCSNFTTPPVNWTPGTWTIDGFTRFRGRGGEHDLISGTIPLGDYSGKSIALSLNISDSNAEAGDFLYYQFYNSSGWSDQQIIYEGDDPTGIYYVTIPEDYLTSNFRMMLTVDFSNSSEYVYLDNITLAPAGLRYPANSTSGNITALVEDVARVNKVLFNGTSVTADAYQTLYPEDQFAGTVFEGTWFYTATADVTGLLAQWIDGGLIESNGAGNYTLGHYYVGTSPSGDDYRVNEEDPDYYFDFYSGGGGTGYPLGTPSPSSNPSTTRYTAAHCGWSLLILYSSPETKRHQLYLYDIQSPNFNFFFGWQNNADFDSDGSPGGTISGFLVPEPITGDTLAGRITVFVGEGDAGYTGDYLKVNSVNMSNAASPANNVWNSESPGLIVPGVDIDTFDITWSSGVLNPGDVEAQIDIPTGTSPGDTDGFTMTYIILSFRSEITSGGTLSYLIRG